MRGNTLNLYIVKTFVSILGISLVLGASAYAVERPTTHEVSALKPDTVLLAEHADGNVRLMRYRVSRDGDADYAVHYRINLSELNSSFEDNSDALGELNTLLDRLNADPDFRVESIIIRGCTSPEGPDAFNAKLAHDRAEQFKAYMHAKYPCCANCTMELRSCVGEWKDCCAAVCSSEVPDKDAVLDVMRSDVPDADKEEALRLLPEAWIYLCREILPPMRKVDLTIGFTEGEEQTMCTGTGDCCLQHDGSAEIVDYNMNRSETRKMERREERKDDELAHRAKDTAEAMDKMEKSVDQYIDDTTAAANEAEIRVDAERVKSEDHTKAYTEKELRRFEKKEARYARKLQRKVRKAERKAHRNLKRAR